MPQLIHGRLKVHSQQIDISADIDLSAIAQDEWVNLSAFDINLPQAGTYIITTQITSVIVVGNVTDTLWIKSRAVIRDEGASVEIANAYRLVNYVQFPEVSEAYYAANCGSFIYNTSEPLTLSVDINVHGSQITTMDVLTNDAFGFGGSFISYYQLGI